jgi:hypothetical protein
MLLVLHKLSGIGLDAVVVGVVEQLVVWLEMAALVFPTAGGRLGTQWSDHRQRRCCR